MTNQNRAKNCCEEIKNICWKYQIAHRVTWQIYNEVIYIIDDVDDLFFVLNDEFSIFCWKTIFNKKELYSELEEFCREIGYINENIIEIKGWVEELLINMESYHLIEEIK